MKKIVILSGAGISAESGIKTFRDLNGLWENFDITQVASPNAWENMPETVLRFYNIRRKNVVEAQPNPGHLALVKLEGKYDVTIITQNVDDLHERAGSKNILHLHGEIRKSRSTIDEKLIYDIEDAELNLGDLCEKGSQKRPHIVWFGERVNNIEKAIEITKKADIFIIIGTSLVVYPAAGLINYVPQNSDKYIVDTEKPEITNIRNLTFIQKNASEGVPQLVQKLMYEQ